MSERNEQAAHEYAAKKAAAYAAKFKTRGVRASAVDAVYLHAYTHFRALQSA